jgi:hypothetical protein
MTAKQREKAALALLKQDLRRDFDWLVHTGQASGNWKDGYRLLVPPEKIVWPPGEWDGRELEVSG